MRSRGGGGGGPTDVVCEALGVGLRHIEHELALACTARRALAFVGTDALPTPTAIVPALSGAVGLRRAAPAATLSPQRHAFVSVISEYAMVHTGFIVAS